MNARKGGLGKGLDALIPTVITSSTGVTIANRNEVYILRNTLKTKLRRREASRFRSNQLWN